MMNLVIYPINVVQEFASGSSESVCDSVGIVYSMMIYLLHVMFCTILYRNRSHVFVFRDTNLSDVL